MTLKNADNSLSNYSKFSNPRSLSNHGADVLALLDKVAHKSNAVDASDVRSHLHIMDKTASLIPFVPNKAQLHFREHRTGRDLILKARQLGFSTEIQSSQFVEAITETILCATLAHDSDTTAKLRRMAGRFYDYLPASLRPERGLDNATTTTYPATGSEITIATAGSGNIGRGGTYNRVHGSEVAFWKDPDAIMAGIMQGVSQSGRIVLESTPNGAQGWFYDRCMEALNGDSVWTLHFYEWWWDDNYRIALDDGETIVYSDDERQLADKHNLSPEQIKWRRAKQRELPHTFKQEYPEDPYSCFLTSGNSYFSSIPHLETVFRAVAILEKRGKRIAGIDFGQKKDFTAVSVFDVATNMEFEIFRVNQLDWVDMRTHIIRLCRKWSIDLLVIEENSAGSVNIAELRKELLYAGLKTEVQNFYTSAQSKPPLIQGLYYALSEGGFLLQPDPAAKRELYTFVASQTPSGAWKYEAENGAHDDTVIARALAWYGKTNEVTISVGRYA
jgi:hypothetical protein